MGRRQSDPDPTRWTSSFVLFTCIVSFLMAYTLFSALFRTSVSGSGSDVELLELNVKEGGCCRGIENLELWGTAVKWGSNFRLNSSEQCCRACKGLGNGGGRSPLCDSWVFCGDRDSCGSRYGECWLKKQKDTLSPEHVVAGGDRLWTSGIIFREGEGIIGLKTDHGTLHIMLHPDCAPHSVSYILKLLSSRHCAGCNIYRAEGRGNLWDSSGNHIQNAGLGPPYALIQGSLKAAGEVVLSTEIRKDRGGRVRRGSVAWAGSGPDFFISLADHEEWGEGYTVFGSVVPGDMWIAERVAALPVKQEVWSGVPVSVLETPVRIWRLHRTKIDAAAASAS